MNERQKEVLQSQLRDEQRILKELKQVYTKAREDVIANIKALEARTDVENLQSIIYQKQYQEALKKQLDAILDEMNGKQFTSISEYLAKSYEDGFFGTMYDLHGQGIPLIIPIDQDQAARAIQLDSKISEGLYERLGVDTKTLKNSIRANVSRGIASNMSWAQVARNIENRMNIGMNRSYRIARTEGHRIQNEARFDAQIAAKSKGADVVKQWDATLDGRTRSTHRGLDGQIQEIEKPFESPGGGKAMFPGGFGIAAEDVNCRCASLQRAKWALDADELKTLKDRAQYFNLDKTQDFEEFKTKYIKAASSESDHLDGLKKQYQDITDNLDAAMAELKSDETKLLTGEYKEKKLEQLNSAYGDVANLDEQEVEKLKLLSSKNDELNARLQKVSDEFYNKPDRRTQPEAYAAWRSKRDELQNEIDKLYSEIADSENARTKLRKYNDYRRRLESIEKNYSSKQELSSKVDSLTKRISAYNEALKKMEDDPMFYDKIYESNVRKFLEKTGVEYREVVQYSKTLTPEEIIARLGGGDLTEGSCASLGLAYIGNIEGYDVLDFRDGLSRKTFGTTLNLKEISKMKGVVSFEETGYNDVSNAKKLLNQMEAGKEYYLVTGQHASMVRKTSDGVLQYLELQSGSKDYSNGWHDFTAYGSIDDTLRRRFGATKSTTIYGTKIPRNSFMIDADSLKGNPEFRKLLGYINTSESSQRKGEHGTVK